MKAIIILAIFLGETLTIYAQLLGATEVADHKPISVFLKTFPVVVIGMGLVLIGYLYGIIAFKDIWVISVTSIVVILIVEPILIYTMFQELPSRGTLVGFVFGVLGFMATIFYK